jgi:hypothetical protein
MELGRFYMQLSEIQWNWVELRGIGRDRWGQWVDQLR